MWKTIALVLALASSSLALRADNPSPATWMNRQQIWELKHSEEVLSELERRRKSFEDEMATGAVPDWAGDYYDGDGLGRNVHLRISPQGGFVSTWSGCMGLYDLNYGPLQLRGNRLTLDFELPNDAAGVGFPREFRFVKWGGRMYLLTEDELKPFVNAVNSGLEPHKECIPSCGFFRVRRGDDARAVSGVPDLPAEYRRLLLDRPITGTVTRILDSESEKDADGYGSRTTTVEIDVGSDAGVWIGMELYADTSAFPGSGFKVIRTQETSSVAVKREFFMDGVPDLEPGICISTRPREQTCPADQTAALR